MINTIYEDIIKRAEYIGMQERKKVIRRFMEKAVETKDQELLVKLTEHFNELIKT